MTTAMEIRPEEHPVVLAGLAPASSSLRDLETAARFADLSDEQLAKKEKRYDLLGMGSFVAGIASPAVIIPLAPLGVNAAMGGAFGIMVIFAGTAFFAGFRGLTYANARKLRETRARQDRERQLISELKDRFSIELSLDELFRLQYPEAEPDVEGTVRYGTIDRMVQDPEGGGARLEQITLVWSDGNFHILRQTNAFKSVEGGELR